MVQSVKKVAMKILVVSPNYFPDNILSELRDVAEIVSKNISHEELLNEIGDYDAVLTRVDTKFSKEILSRAKKLKVIGSATTGLDHIERFYAEKKGIHIVNLSGTHTLPTAEYAFSLMLSLAKKIPWAHNSLSKGTWERHKFFGNNMEGKILGVIGFGKIGSKVGKYAKNFGMNVLVYDPYISKSIAEDMGAKITTLDDLLKNSDFISLHAYLSPETKNIINAKAFSKMKPTAFLINVGRGELVDEDDLLDALTKKKIAGAALDVFIDEPLPKDSELIKYAKSHNNLLITPHIAASTEESVREAAKEIVHNVKEFLIAKDFVDLQGKR